MSILNTQQKMNLNEGINTCTTLLCVVVQILEIQKLSRPNIVDHMSVYKHSNKKLKEATP